MKTVRVLINKNFALLWFGKFISQTGDKFYALALAWWLLEKTNSAAMMGLLFISSLAPGLVTGLFAGPFVDRWSRKKIIIWTDAARGILIGLVTALAISNNLQIWEVIVISMLISSASAFFDPAALALVPEIVDENDLPRANSMNQLIGGVCTVLGPVAGALVVSFFGTSLVFLVNSISFFLSMILSFGLDYKKGRQEKESTKYLDEIKEGIRFIMGHKSVKAIIIVIGIAHLFMGGIFVSMPILAKSLPGVGVRNLGNFETMLGIGLIGASLFLGRLKFKTIKLSVLFNIMAGAGLFIFVLGAVNASQSPVLIFYSICFAAIGGVIATASVFWQSLLQNSTPGHLTGRVFAVSSLAGNLSLPLAFGLFGSLLEVFPFSTIMISSGALLLIINLVMRYSSLSNADNNHD